MSKFYAAFSALVLLITASTFAQPTKPATPATCNASNCTTTNGANPWDQCVAPNTAFISDFRSPVLASGTALTVGAVYRYKNVGTASGVQINATVTINAIFQAVLNNIDDDASADPTVNIEFFAPRIGTDAGSLTTTDRRGYVQFTVRFFVEAAPLLAGFHTGGGSAANNNADFNNPVSLSNLNLIHYDNDGNTAGTGGTGWFRETGVVQDNTPGNVSVIAAGTTELRSYTYNDGVNKFSGFAGSVCERNNVSRCTQVAEYYRFNVATNQITFRLGYDYQGAPGASGTTAPRQFGTRFNCVNLPGQGTLPLKLLSFNVIHKDGNANLVWKSIDEIGFSHFEVERSTDARNFSPLSQINSRGAGRATEDYNYNDDIKAVTSSVVYYRLKMVDLDGSYTYSQVVVLKRGFGSSKLNISPNPASSNATMRFRIERSASADIIIADLSGKIVSQRKINLQSGENNISLPELAKLTNGVYSIKLVTEGEVITDRIVVNK
jgi:Secretion system C-terminal sorting domain